MFCAYFHMHCLANANLIEVSLKCLLGLHDNTTPLVSYKCLRAVWQQDVISMLFQWVSSGCIISVYIREKYRNWKCCLIFCFENKFSAVRVNNLLLQLIAWHSGNQQRWHNIDRGARSGQFQSPQPCETEAKRTPLCRRKFQIYFRNESSWQSFTRTNVDWLHWLIQASSWSVLDV